MDTDPNSITAGDIPWELEPVHTRDADPPLYLEALTRDELLLWALDAQGDMEAITFTLKRTLTALHDVMVERDALRKVVRERRR